MNNNLGNKETMAKNIRYYMDLHHVNSVEMCRILDVPQSTFSYWLNAKTYPRIDKIEKMAAYFHIEKSDLIEERSDAQTKSNISDDDIRFALFHGADVEITDEMFDEVKRFAKFVAEREKEKKKES